MSESDSSNSHLKRRSPTPPSSMYDFTSMNQDQQMNSYYSNRTPHPQELHQDHSSETVHIPIIEPNHPKDVDIRVDEHDQLQAQTQVPYGYPDQNQHNYQGVGGSVGPSYQDLQAGGIGSGASGGNTSHWVSSEIHLKVSKRYSAAIRR